MQFLFDNETNFDFNNDLINLTKKVILETLKFENFTENIEISFSIVSSEEIKEINLQHRNINKETDVLSFPLLEFPLKYALNENIITPLGDIIISIEKAISQAKEYGHSLEREIAFLTVHSMLHLLGYDHMNEEEEKTMFQKQDDILNKLNIKR